VAITLFPQELGEALAGPLGELHAATIPASEQMGHRIGGRHGRAPIALLLQGLKRLAHHFGLGAAGFSCDPVEEARGARIDSDIQRAHNGNLYHSV